MPKQAPRKTLLRTPKLATSSQGATGTPWRLPKKPTNPSQTAQAHVLANAENTAKALG